MDAVREVDEIGLITEVRERQLRLEKLLAAGAAASQIVSAAKFANDMRNVLAATQLRWETVAAARQAGRDEQAPASYAEGWRDCLKATAEGRRVIEFPARQPLSA